MRRHVSKLAKLSSSQRPSDGEAHFLLARTARRAGALDDALRELHMCADLAVEDQALELERILLRVQRGDLGGELASYDAYLQQRAEDESVDTLPILVEGDRDQSGRDQPSPIAEVADQPVESGTTTGICRLWT